MHSTSRDYEKNVEEDDGEGSPPAVSSPARWSSIKLGSLEYVPASLEEVVSEVRIEDITIIYSVVVK